MTTKKIGSLHQGIVFNELAKFVPEIRPTTVDSWGYNEINFFITPYMVKYHRWILIFSA